MGAAHAGAESRTRRVFSVVGSAAFLVLAPGTIVGFVPWWMSRWRVHAPFPGFTALRVVGFLLMALGAGLLLETFARFAVQGVGTPAPVFPTRRLVVTGSYRYVRNPMYVAVVSLILAQGLVFGDWRVFVYGLAGWLVTYLFVLVYEEPTLRRTFGSEYAVYCAHVGRWIPRLSAWGGGG